MRTLPLITAAIALFAAPAFAYTYNSPTLYDQMDGTTVYVTGGIGENELAELEAAKSDYNVYIMSTDKSGAYVSDTSVVITDSKGRDVIATNTGPLLYVNLPAGRYKVMAENSGIVQTKSISVSAKKPASLHLTWDLAE